MRMVEKECNSCGNMIMVDLDRPDCGVNEQGHYFGTIRLGIGMWGKYSYKKDENGEVKWVRCISYWRELWYRLLDFKRLLLHQYIDAEYWECDNCFKGEDDGEI